MKASRDNLTGGRQKTVAHRLLLGVVFVVVGLAFVVIPIWLANSFVDW